MHKRATKQSTPSVFVRSVFHLVLCALVLFLAGCLGLIGSGLGPLPLDPGLADQGVASGVVSYALHAPIEPSLQSVSTLQAPTAARFRVPSFPASPGFDTPHAPELMVHLASAPPSQSAVPDSVEQLLAKLGGTIDRWLRGPGSLVVRLPEGSDIITAAELFEQLPDVLAAEPNRYVWALSHPTLRPNDPDFPRQWHLSYIQMPKAWAVETGRPDVIIAVLDTGYSEHPDLPQEGDPRLVHPHSVFTVAPDYLDDGQGHGATVAAIAVANTDNRAYGAGVGWQVGIMPVRVLRQNEAGREIGTEADVAEGIYWAADHGAHVINLSFGLPRDSRVSHALQQALDYAIERGVTIVAAAGNDGNSHTVVSPASHPGVIAVGAVTPQSVVAKFSNTGHRARGIQLDIVAPGTAILSTISTPGLLTSNHGIHYFDGTSFAAPQVAGVVALLYARGTLSRSMGAAAPELAQTILRETAAPLQPGQAYADVWGYGALDAYAALTWDTRPRLDEAQVFTAMALDDAWHVLSDVAHPDRYGEFTLAAIPPGQQTLVAWIDTDQSGHINPGDFVGCLDRVVIEANTMATRLQIDLRPAIDEMAVVPRSQFSQIAPADFESLDAGTHATKPEVHGDELTC